MANVCKNVSITGQNLNLAPKPIYVLKLHFSGSAHVFTVIPRYCEICLEFSFSYELMKYTLLQMLRDLQDKDLRGLRSRSSYSTEEIAACWGVVKDETPQAKKSRLDNTEKNNKCYQYDRNHFNKMRNWPKLKLEMFLRNTFGKEFKRPVYSNERREKDGRYTTKLQLFIRERNKEFQGGFERNKKEAEQSAVLQAVLELGLLTPEECGLSGVTLPDKNWENVINEWAES